MKNKYVIIFIMAVVLLMPQDAFCLRPLATMVGTPKSSTLFDIPLHDQKDVSILLIYPRALTQEAIPEKHPISLMLLSSAFLNNSYMRSFARAYPAYGNSIPNVSVKILDLQTKPADFDLASYLKNLNPDIVGVTSATELFNRAVAISQITKNAVPTALRILGGSHVSAIPKKALELSQFQIGVMGYGEETLTELAILRAQNTNPDLSKVAGIAFKETESTVVVNMPRVARIPLSATPYANEAIDLLDLKSYRQNVRFELEKGVITGPLGFVFTALGCPFGCKFCASLSKIVRKRKPESVVEEMDFLYKKGFRLFQFLDDTFSIDLKAVKKLCDLIIEKSWSDDVEWIASSRANLVDRELLVLMKKAGCVGIALGVETGDPDLLKDMDKGVNLDDIRKIRQLCKEIGLSVKYFIMVGYPGQDWKSVSKTAEFIIETKPTHATVSICVPLPGSAIYNDSRIKLSGRSWATHPEPGRRTAHIASPVETDKMSAEDIGLARDLLMEINVAVRNNKIEEATLVLDAIKKKAHAGMECASQLEHAISLKAVSNFISQAA